MTNTAPTLLPLGAVVSSDTQLPLVLFTFDDDVDGKTLCSNALQRLFTLLLLGLATYFLLGLANMLIGY